MRAATRWWWRSRAWRGAHERRLRGERVADGGAVRLSAVRVAQAREVLMPALTWALIGVFLLLVLACVKPLGLYMANVFEGRPNWALRTVAPFERWTWRLCGI